MLAPKSQDMDISKGDDRTAELLKEGKTIARRAAAELLGEERTAFAVSFCLNVIAAYWTAIQSDWQDSWPLPDIPSSAKLSPLNSSLSTLAHELGTAASSLEPLKASYSIGTFYTATLPDSYRRSFGAYYTPPSLTARLLEMATQSGVDWESCQVLDPACGGGAFLAPLALKIVEALGPVTPKVALQHVEKRIHGYEIDPFGAWMAQVFLEASMMKLSRAANMRIHWRVKIRDSLRHDRKCEHFDLVIGNPPYGKVNLSGELRSTYNRSLYGHANLYGLFADLSLRLLKPGGIVAFVTPTSFLSGQYFKSLRRLLGTTAPPVMIEFVEDRKGVFDNVLQETLLATYRKDNSPKKVAIHYLSTKEFDDVTVDMGEMFCLPEDTGSPWLLPRNAGQERLVRRLLTMPHRLVDYGYRVSTGPLVWNRHKGQLSNVKGRNCYPLVWAESVTTDGRFIYRADKRNHKPYFQAFGPSDNWLIVQRPCVLVQRTTAKEQKRRLIAAEMPRDFVKRHGGAVVENHLNMVFAAEESPAVSPDVLATLLNTDVVDQAFRCLNGSVAVSAYELESLPLPDPVALLEQRSKIDLRSGNSMIEQIVEGLYYGDDA